MGAELKLPRRITGLFPRKCQPRINLARVRHERQRIVECCKGINGWEVRNGIGLAELTRKPNHSHVQRRSHAGA